MVGADTNLGVGFHCPGSYSFSALAQHTPQMSGPVESQQVIVSLDMRAFSYYHVRQHNGNAAPGDFAILIGSSSVDIRLQGKRLLDPGLENR